VASSKKDAKRRRRAKALAERAERLERHAALVAERAGDPRYVQRTRNQDGSYHVTLPPEAVQAIRQQARSFREKFGRDMGPDDPVFFDPDADEPLPLSEERYNELFREMAENIEDPELRPFASAWADVGYIVTEENQHLFTAYEVEAFGKAVARHREEETALDDFHSFIVETLQNVVLMLADGSAKAELPRFLLNRLLEEAEKETADDLGPLIAAMVVLPLAWVAAAGRLVDEDGLSDAVNWVAENLGGLEYAGPAAVVATAIHGGKGAEELTRRLGKSGQPTVNDLSDTLGQDFGPAMLWLCAGLLATVGEGDPEWLFQLDRARESDESEADA
jgi:hypothetical protein